MQSQTNSTTEQPVLGLDLGQRATGVALTVHGKIASGYETIHHKSRKELINALRKIIQDEHVTMLVVGDPGKQNPNHETPQSLERTISAIEQEFSEIKVVRHSEQFTSQIADQFMQLSGQKKQPNHKKAAEIILQSYLDTNK